MVKKLQKMAQQPKVGAAGLGQLLDSQLASTVKDSAQQIWLAGLGAFAKAQEEGGKVFETLVKEGVSIQRRTQAVAEEKIGEVAGKVSSLAGEVQHKAGQSWDKLESIFEDRVAKALGKLGVPSSQEVAALIERIDALSAQVAALGGSSASPAVKLAGRRSPRAKAAPSVAVEAAAPAKKPAARKPRSAKVASATPAESPAAAPARKARAPRRKAAAEAA